MGLIGASLALLDTDLSSSLCIAFVIHLLLRLPTAFPPLLHHSHQPPASLYERLLSGAQRWLPVILPVPHRVNIEVAVSVGSNADALGVFIVLSPPPRLRLII